MLLSHPTNSLGTIPGPPRSNLDREGEQDYTNIWKFHKGGGLPCGAG